ncbi:MAG: L-2-amino-thiazoline-4-carboxylic acid hydrolase [bacterium]
MDKETAIKALKESIKTRALLYWEFYRVFSEELGEEKAAELMKKAIYNRGTDKAGCAGVTPGDFSGLAENFRKGGEKSLEVFGHEVAEAAEDYALLRLNSCPLVEAWKEAGLTDGQIASMCDIAYAVDFGKFEGMGFHLKFQRRISDDEPSCDLHITKP